MWITDLPCLCGQVHRVVYPFSSSPYEEERLSIQCPVQYSPFYFRGDMVEDSWRHLSQKLSWKEVDSPPERALEVKVWRVSDAPQGREEEEYAF
ncbi:MAG: hypothetical protein D6805_00255 [Planctomycetota bacterium]|nr:MAG: hypothetical protein D6805_00255 [Planctomycetota bacterium]